MYLNKFVPLFTAVALVATATATFAQTATAPAAPATAPATTTATPAPTPSTPAAAHTETPATVPGAAIDASTVTPANPVVAPATTNTVPMDASKQVMLQSVMLVNLPKADGSTVDKLVEAVNGRDWEKYSSMYSKESFNLMTADGESISTPEALKAMWDRKMSDPKFKNHKATATVESVKELAPGIAFTIGKLNIAFDANHSAMAHFTMLTKYEENAWKIIAMDASSKDVMKMVLADEMKPQGNMMMDILYVVFGTILGFVIAKLMGRKIA